MKEIKTKCLGCDAKFGDKPLFMLPKARHKDDVWCKDCMEKGDHVENAREN